MREKFGSSEFTAKQVKTAITDAAFGVSFERSDIELALIDLVGADVAGRSARSLGIVLKNRQGLIARGLKLTCRNDRRTNQNWYRVEEADAGRGGGSGPHFGRTRQAAS